MSHKYYYLKLKENYFDQDNIQLLESMDNGHIYSLIILKLYLKCLRNDGQLMMTERIPYDPSKINILAKVIHHDPDHVKNAIQFAKELDIIEILETGEMFLTEMQSFIGKSSDEADRKRLYRANIDQKRLQSGQMSRQIEDGCPDKSKTENAHINKGKLDLELIKGKLNEEIDSDADKDPLSPSPKPQSHILLTIFKEENKKLPDVISLSKERLKKCAARLKVDGFEERFRQAVRLAQNSKFLLGENNNGWKASFDWFIANETNVLKVIEGRYSDKKPDMQTTFEKTMQKYGGLHE
jgi:predicted phage replisome organizer